MAVGGGGGGGGINSFRTATISCDSSRTRYGVGGMAVPLEKVSTRTFVPRYKCSTGHSYLGKYVPPGKSVPSPQ